MNERDRKLPVPSDADRRLPVDVTLDEADIARDAAALAETWKSPRGLWGMLTTVDHKQIGLRYIATCFGFFLLAGLAAGLMRIQLSGPERHFLNPDLYNQIFTTHGTSMMFLFAVPVMTAMGLYLVPLMIGTRDVAFPRLNAYGYWTFLAGGLVLWVSLFGNNAPDAGWFNYVPLSGPEYSPGHRVDVWAQTVTFTEIAALVAAVILIVTIFKQRAPGMSLSRMPIFVWSMLIISFQIVFAMPVVETASFLLASDRMVATHFFNPAEGGDALLWQHMFWFFGHPEVYIMFLPGMAMLSEIITTFSRRPIVGYPAIVLSMVMTAFVSFGLWVHHMFATPVPELGASFFTAASVLIALPTGVQIFCWIATLWTGRPEWKTPLLYVIGFMVVFIIGGMSGVMIASVAFDKQVHDTFFIVAHFHYVILGGVVFPFFAGVYYWFPKFSGRMLGERLGTIQFWLLLIGINVTFFPMHFLGFAGMPRRVYTYLPETGWGPLNLLASSGAVLIVLAVAVFIVNVVVSWRAGAIAGPNPWRAPTLEWATESPPAPYAFVHTPVVESRAPLWEAALDQPVVTGLRTDKREMLVTTIYDARPDHRQPVPLESIWPFVLAVTTTGTFVGAIFVPEAIPVGIAVSLLAFIPWVWPKKRDLEPEHVELPDGTHFEAEVA